MMKRRSIQPPTHVCLERGKVYFSIRLTCPPAPPLAPLPPPLDPPILCCSMRSALITTVLPGDVLRDSAGGVSTAPSAAPLPLASTYRPPSSVPSPIPAKAAATVPIGAPDPEPSLMTDTDPKDMREGRDGPLRVCPLLKVVLLVLVLVVGSQDGVLRVNMPIWTSLSRAHTRGKLHQRGESSMKHVVYEYITTVDTPLPPAHP